MCMSPVAVSLHFSGRPLSWAPPAHVRAACLGRLSLALPAPRLRHVGPTSTPGVGSLLLCCPDPASCPPMSPRHLLPLPRPVGSPVRQAPAPRDQGCEELE